MIPSLRNPKTLPQILKMLESIRSRVSQHPCVCLLGTILFLHVLFVCFNGAVPPEASSIISSPQFHQPPVSGEPNAGHCESGYVYVYELPLIFNAELVENCADLDLWHWRCDAVSNHGYGKLATELAGVVPENLAPAWYRTNQFSSEIIFHKRLLNHRCRTLEPESATAFYIPFYAGLAVGKYLFFPDRVKDRDRPCEMLMKWVQGQHYWKRSNGSDHFMVLGRITWDFRRFTDPEKLWGSSFLNMPLMHNVTRLTIERAPADYYDVGIPYPTGFHPNSDSEVVQWQTFVRNRNRTRLFSFIGATRSTIKNDFRGLLLSQCMNESESCRAVNCAVKPCANDTSAILEALLESDFCLQPRGDSYTRRSVFDCVLAGSVPVFFWKRTAYDQYEWFLPGEPESWSVFIDHNEVRKGTSIRQVLERYRKEEVKKMKKKVIECIPKIVYARDSQGMQNVRDAVDIAVDGVLSRFKKHHQSSLSLTANR